MLLAAVSCSPLARFQVRCRFCAARLGGGGDGVGLTDVKVYGFGHNWTLSPNFLIDGNFGFTDMDQQVLTADAPKARDEVEAIRRKSLAVS